MTQNIPTDRMQDHPTVPRMYPTARTPMDVAAVPLDADYDDRLPEAGFPDIEEQGLKYAAGQRATARAEHDRNATTVGTADPGEISPGSGVTMRGGGIAQPTQEQVDAQQAKRKGQPRRGGTFFPR